MTGPEDASSFRGSLQRGVLLRNQRRYPEAEKFFQQAIGEEPQNAEGYHELAFCYCNWDGHAKQALATIDRAISLDPNRSDFLALRAWILENLDRHQDAIGVAGDALGLHPGNVMALNAQARAHVSLHEWKKAEAIVRRVLALQAGNELAANLLALTLRQQRRFAESDAVTASLLSRVPDDAMAQSNAGWSALHNGDHRRANLHFLEALRLEPGYEYARRGLLHAFNSRVWIYRIYFQFVAWLGRHRKGMRYFFLILIYIAYRTVVITLQREYGAASSYWVAVLVALYLVIFGFGRSFGNFFLLFDPFARHALTVKENRWAIFAAVFYAFFLGIEIAGHAWAQTAVLAVIPASFLWAVLTPRLADRWTRARSAPEA
jgi:tetratricopeptide (TPR) repeat protein